MENSTAAYFNGSELEEEYAKILEVCTLIHICGIVGFIVLRSMSQLLYSWTRLYLCQSRTGSFECKIFASCIKCNVINVNQFWE